MEDLQEQAIQINRFKKYVDASNTMSYMVNVDNTGLNFSDDEEIKKTYTIEAKEFDYVKIFIPHDMLQVKNKLTETINIEAMDNFTVAIVDSCVVVDNISYDMREYTQIIFMLSKRLGQLKFKNY